MKSNSLQAKLTWPLAVSVTVCTLVILVVVTDLTYRTYRNELAIRSEQIGKSAQEALEITPESARRSQLISEYGASEAVRYMAIAEGSPLRVQTATQRKFIGQPLAAVSPQATRLARTARATGRSQTAWLSDGGGLVRAVPLRVPGETPSLKGVREAVLLVQVNDDYLQSSVRRNGTAVFLVMILLFSGLVGLLYSMVRTQVIRPVGQLRDFVEARLAGNTRARFSSSADDELAQLGASFERLLTDIDVERQRGTDALTELETVNRRLAGVINAAADAIIACGEDGTIGLINPAGEKLLGYTLADLAGLTLSDLVPGIASARPDAGEYIQAQALTRAGQLVPVEMTLSRSDGSQGTPLLAILRDITERLEAEQELRISQERLELAARGGQLGTWDWNTETGVCHVNEIWLEVNGLATERPSSDTVHAAWMERMDSASLQRSAEALSMIDLGDHDVMEVTVRLRIAEGEWRWIHNRGEVIERSETGKAVRLAGVSRDITAMVAARRELEVTRDDALQAFKARSEFLANISHELRTPLNGVLGMLTLLHGSRLDSEQREFVHVAERSGRSLATLINDVLDFSKLEAGEVLPEDIPFSLRELAEDVVRMCAESAQRKNVDIALIVHRAVAPILRGDPARTGQVLTNLVTNAVKFTEVGEVTVEIMPDPSLEDMLRITVRDTGIGIPADLQSGIFEAFSQADGSTTRKYGGSGLGLTISRQLVEAMHGTISVESVPGEGSSFHISLPLPSAGDEKSGGLPSAADLSSKRVLVIDDSASRLRAVQEILEPAGCDVVGVTDPDKQVAALARLAANGEGVDVVMIAHEDDPASTGQLIETTRQSEASAAARIILTMPFTAALSAGIRAMQVDAKLTRPVRGKALLEAVAAGPNRSLPPGSAAASESPRLLTEPLSRERLLVVDDVPVNLQVAVGMLGQHGFEADVAENGADAVAAVTGGTYGLVLMDCQMPGMDGYEATQVIRAAGDIVKQPVIIAMTASAMTGDYQKCLRAGMDDYLSKPLDEKVLVGTVRNWLSGSEPRSAVGARLAGAGRGRIGGMSAAGDKAAKLEELSVLLGAESVAELVAVFLEDTAERIEAMQASLAEHDIGAIRTAAHAVKGSSANLGFSELEVLCKRLETASGEAAPWLLADAAAAYESLAARLREDTAADVDA